VRTIGDGWVDDWVILWVFSNLGDSMILGHREATKSMLTGTTPPRRQQTHSVNGSNTIGGCLLKAQR